MHKFAPFLDIFCGVSSSISSIPLGGFDGVQINCRGLELFNETHQRYLIFFIQGRQLIQVTITTERISVKGLNVLLKVTYGQDQSYFYTVHLKIYICVSVLCLFVYVYIYI